MEHYQDIVSRPGKFEGESAYVPYYWDEVLSGGSDRDILGDDDYTYSVFKVNDTDIRAFPELSEYAAVIVWEDTFGFVHCIEFDTLPSLNLTLQKTFDLSSYDEIT